MRVACDNCGASYKIPDTKLTKEVNKATCRKCGHAMYIRRPGAAEPEIPSVDVSVADERTVITNPYEPVAAVESTETGAPLPAWAAPPSPNNGDLAESTIPRDIPSAPGFPPPPRGPAPAIGLSSSAGAMPVVPPPRWDPMPLGAAVPSMPVTSDLPRGRPITSAPGVDARSDLGLALFGSVLAGIGTGVGVLGGGSGMVGTAGVFLALLGALTSLLVLVTGDRGARAASWGVSLVGAVGLAVVGAVGASVVSPAELPVTQGQAQVPVAQASTGSVQTAPVGAAPVGPVAVPVIEPTRPESIRFNSSASREPRTNSRPAAAEPTPPVAQRTAPVERSEPPPKPKADPAPERKPASSSSASSSSSAAPTLPLAVIDTMIKSNKAVKSCFIQEKKATGEIPSGVKVKLVIQPSGKVSSAGLTGGDWAGTDFDSCVSGAVRGITFPPFEGDPVKMTYPFVTG